MKTIKSIWVWLKRNPWAILSALIGVFGAFLLYKRKDNQISSLEDALVVSNTKRKVAGLEARSSEILKQAGSKTAEIQEIDKKLSESKRLVVELHVGANVKEMSDDEVARLFSGST